MPTLREQLPEIMNRFDFARAQRAMIALDWRWATADGSVIPGIEHLKSTAHRLLDCAVSGFEGLDAESKKYGYSASTGGFEARVESFSNAEPRLELLFYVDHKSGSLN